MSNQWCTNEICDKSCTIERRSNCQLGTTEESLVLASEYCYLPFTYIIEV